MQTTKNCRLSLAACGLVLSASTALAGGLDRSGQGINLIFEEGDAFQLRYRYVDPSLSGTSLVDGSSTGDVGQSYGNAHFGYKQALNDKLDVALIYDEPYGAHVEYDAAYYLSGTPAGTGSSPLGVLSAEADTQALTGLFRYKLDGGFSLLGGLRLQTAEAQITVPAAGYTTSSDKPWDLGYIVGVAWEKPEIAARVALTYNSSIKQTLNLTELQVLAGPSTHSANIETPQSLNLDFQTGVAANTLVFGSIRWVDWSNFALTSPNYPGGSPAGTLVSYDDDAITYTLGVGRKFSERFSGAIQVSYEESQGGTVSDLGPSDGFLSVGIGGTYTSGNTQFSLGVSYIDIGDAITDNGGVFTGNDAWAAGFQITYHFD
ncbi:transporter [Shimia sp. CNT1-13L.2]|uniref:OmpP1/FadL family transporter n=1 Tax=Shimia sp. CNT1-13L.2 TaxID=2959663 RepID=UPI0020CD977F|nr:transporter [Shimia sp. CNT1-13L.2]MCP9482064.1 transporter [Shimia sp. CNT1-13L.2]